MKTETLARLRAARAGRQSVARVMALDGSVDAVVEDGDGPLPETVLELARAALKQNRSYDFEHEGARWFVQAFNPPLRLVVVGAVHISQPLIRMAESLGYDVTLVDPRSAFATAARFPGVTISDEWPDDALETLDVDGRTAVVTLTHDPKLDDPALHVALRSEAFYIGALGSRRTHEKRAERLAGAGFDEAAISRIHAPIGLDLGGRAPAEIALAIAAQMTEALYR
ncbi:MAG: XdhC family protein [Alphaproteobacteria bacterium]|nr:XdhC family protein [Alphaproteobacteria bacterium]